MSDQIPEINVRDLAAKLKTDEKFTILDVRELWETNYAKLNDPHVVNLPMSQIAQEREKAFPAELSDPQSSIVVMCHHGVRSAQVTGWMRQKGWQHVVSLAGGIDAYATQIDPSVGSY